MAYRLTLLCFAFTLAGQAAFASGAPVDADTKARLENQAEKACSDDLDHDRFGNYSTMEECVADKLHKLMQTQHASAAPTQAVAAAH